MRHARVVVGSIIVISALVATSMAQNVGNWQCADEVVQPNLVLKAKTHIYGELKDRSGAALEQSKVILRKQTKTGRFVAYRITTTDHEGKFDFKAIEAGNFRFLPGPNRGWKQPKDISCWGSSECEVKLTVEVNPTDMPFAQCPIQ